MNELAKRIKHYRVKEEITQKELSKGIISVSYLSKIENGVAQPPIEILELLCRRLNIEVAQVIDQETKLKDLCITWFKFLFYNDRENFINNYELIEESLYLITDSNLVTLIEIHKLRYYILMNEYENADKQYQLLNKIKANFNNTEQHYWLKFKGYYYFIKNSYHKALEAFELSINHFEEAFYLVTEGKYALNYMIALTASHTRQLYITLTNANKALSYYQKNYNLKECAKCHILIGITYTRFKNYEEALMNYKLAETIANNINENNILSTILQNIGNLHFISNRVEDAVYYFINSYEIRKAPNKKIVPVSSLMKLYFKNSDFLNAQKWYEIGKELIKNNLIDDIYIYEFNVYYHLLHGIEEQSFNNLILNQILPILDEKKMHFEKITYIEILANYYFETRRYKLSSIYFKQALDIQKEL